jgi:hypothetical protein
VVFPFPLSITSKSACQAFTFGGVALVLLKPIYLDVLGEGRSVAAALGVWAMVFPALSLLITHRLMGRKLGALFRL